MRTIVMDTSNHYLAIALYEDGLLRASRQLEALKQQSELAIPVLKDLMDGQHWQMKDIDEMVVSLGPGSYTGVRIAMTIAKTLSSVMPIRLKAISSLAMLAGDQKAIPIIDARGNKLYVGMYENGEPLMEDTLMEAEAFETFKAEHPDFPVVALVDEIPLCDNLYLLSRKVPYIKESDRLVPTYIKGVEAKKQC
ncbi:MAG: tRNA (adenosine(37)-N6)-threonylcarbamoyltransferase complex dimerization subunit type 1 TsaB [Beduini sp.]|uniref:tRNA (adenosine(37)-N6)-threonylcarbamoyltransferase complex dimerization subunit type 1 TsaB n=1 Tax=Beduini sp. TaxID=1922300 RepID=UPI0039A39AF5